VGFCGRGRKVRPQLQHRRSAIITLTAHRYGPHGSVAPSPVFGGWRRTGQRGQRISAESGESAGGAVLLAEGGPVQVSGEATAHGRPRFQEALTKDAVGPCLTEESLCSTAPRHRSVRALLTHTAPTSSQTRRARLRYGGGTPPRARSLSLRPLHRHVSLQGPPVEGPA